MSVYRGIEFQEHFQKGGMALDYSFSVDGVSITKEIATKLKMKTTSNRKTKVIRPPYFSMGEAQSIICAYLAE
jgi:hypothetical protein